MTQHVGLRLRECIENLDACKPLGRVRSEEGPKHNIVRKIMGAIESAEKEDRRSHHTRV